MAIFYVFKSFFVLYWLFGEQNAIKFLFDQVFNLKDTFFSICTRILAYFNRDSEFTCQGRECLHTKNQYRPETKNDSAECATDKFEQKRHPGI